MPGHGSPPVLWGHWGFCHALAESGGLHLAPEWALRTTGARVCLGVSWGVWGQLSVHTPEPRELILQKGDPHGASCPLGRRWEVSEAFRGEAGWLGVTSPAGWDLLGRIETRYSGEGKRCGRGLASGKGPRTFRPCVLLEQEFPLDKSQPDTPGTAFWPGPP